MEPQSFKLENRIFTEKYSDVLVLEKNYLNKFYVFSSQDLKPDFDANELFPDLSDEGKIKKKKKKKTKKIT